MYILDELEIDALDDEEVDMEERSLNKSGRLRTDRLPNKCGCMGRPARPYNPDSDVLRDSDDDDRLPRETGDEDGEDETGVIGVALALICISDDPELLERC